MTRIDVKHIATVATMVTGKADPDMTREEGLDKLREIAFAAGVTVRRGRIYVPGRRSYFAGSGDTTPEGLKSMWTEFGYAVRLGGTDVSNLRLVELLQEAADVDRSWIKRGNGPYLCTEHRMQFKTVAASQAHGREAHPETLWTSVARGEWKNEAYAAKIVNTTDMGGGWEMWLGGKLWDTGYKSFEHARDCFVDMAARGEAQRVTA